MTNGVNSPSAGGFEFISRISQNKTTAQKHLAKASPESPQAEQPKQVAPTAEAGKPSLHDYSLLDLAARDFSRILPSIESLTNPVE